MSTIVEIIIKNRNSNRMYSPSIDTIDRSNTFFVVIFWDNFSIKVKKTLKIDTVKANELIFVIPRRRGGKKMIQIKAKKYVFLFRSFSSKLLASERTEKNKITDCMMHEVMIHCGLMKIL
ncbi:hypothetical protein DBR28_14615 [Chryseobacterium sp. HMWF028]|nr:hypothetical protein DBR28_14615 [Chryseobacterium sp. HMWF028]